ncbi:hypothetical protein [Candidatus Poriferisodalis sp.]|uniref:hypothetical protein n=1 Tax=Candidatus Poriferisodalis sp. TaxID=3101277 RepID=UPI003B0170D5
MSTLWTPGGEHRVPRETPAGPSPDRSDGTAGGASASGADASRTADDPGGFGAAFDIDPETGYPIDPRTGEPFDPEELAEMNDRLREAQEQLVSVPSAEIVQNHMMGLFELAALHLRRDPPDLAEAKLPIDALGLLVDQLADELPAADTLRGALQQIRLAYVEVHKHLTAAE